MNNSLIGILMSGHVRSLECVHQQTDYRIKLIAPLRKDYTVNIFASLASERVDVPRDRVTRALAALGAHFFQLSWNHLNLSNYHPNCIESYRLRRHDVSYDRYTTQWIRISEAFKTMVEYEKQHNLRHVYVMRLRPDLVPHFPRFPSAALQKIRTGATFVGSNDDRFWVMSRKDAVVAENTYQDILCLARPNYDYGSNWNMSREWINRAFSGAECPRLCGFNFAATDGRCQANSRGALER